MSLRVEIVLAFRDCQYLREQVVPAGTCLGDLVRTSGILEFAPDLDVETLSWAIHGRLADPWTPLREGDRVELLRPLSVDPKQARRRRIQLKSAVKPE